MNNEIQQMVLAYCDAIEKQDQDAFNDLFDRDATLISIATLFQGRDTIINDFLKRLHSIYLSIKLIPENISIRFLNSEMAVVIFEYHTECIRREDGSNYGIAGLETQVFVLKEDSWKITHLHYSKK